MKSKANIERNAIRGYCEVDYSVLSRMKIVLTGGLLSDFLYRIASKLDFDGGNHSVLTCRWFGGALYIPTIKLSKTVLNKPLFTLLRDSLMQNSFFGLIAYYLNQSANQDYSNSFVNGGIPNAPVLFIEARFDYIIVTSISCPVNRILLETIQPGYYRSSD
jgi:hypothetical protein